MDAAELDAAVDRVAHHPTLVDGSAAAIVAFVSGHYGLPIDEVAGGSKSGCAVTARRVALAMGARWGHSSARMATELGISRTAAAKLRRTSDSDVDRAAGELAERWRVDG